MKVGTMPNGTEGNGNSNPNPPAGGDGGKGGGVSFPQYVKDNLGKEVFEDLSKRAEKEPELLKAIPATLPDLFKAWDSGRSELATALRRPAENASREEWDSFYNKLGRPNSPKDYAFDKPELPKGMAYDQTLIDAISQTAFEEGVSGKALKKIFATFNTHQIGQYNALQAKLVKEGEDKKAARTKARDASLEENRKVWAANYDTNLALVSQMFKDDKRVSPTLRKRLMDADLDNDPEMQRILLLAARRSSEDRKLGIAPEAGGEEDEGKPRLRFPNTEKRFPARSRSK